MLGPSVAICFVIAGHHTHIFFAITTLIKRSTLLGTLTHSLPLASHTHPMASVASSGAKPSPSPPIQIPPSATLLSGATSGLVSCILLQPLDLLKTRLQQANSRTAPLGTKTQRLANTIQNVVAQDGIKGLWRGTWPTILRNVPGVALYFYSVTELRRQLATQPVKYLSVAQSSPTATANTPAKPTSTGNLLAGAFARVTVGFILCPITVVKARFEVSASASYAN